MIIRCAWCKKIISEKGIKKDDNLESHSICKKCITDYFPEYSTDYFPEYSNEKNIDGK